METMVLDLTTMVYIIDQDGREVPMYGTSTILTLTDRKDLDNGLFQPGDEVLGSAANYPQVTEYVAGSNNSATAQGKVTTKYRISGADIFADWPDDSQTVKLSNLFRDAVWNMIWWEHTTADSADADQVSSRGPDEESTIGNWKATLKPDKYYSFSYYGFDVTNPDTAYGPVGTDVPTPISFTGPAITVVSIDPTSPEMSVSGGTWSIGGTVKNTVARAPEITPTTDEITGYQTGVIYSNQPTTGTAFSASYVWKVAFSDEVTTDGAVASIGSGWYVQSFDNIAATKVSLIYSADYDPVSSNIQINGTTLTAANSTSGADYTGSDLASGFTNAKIIEYDLSAAGETKLTSVGVWSSIRICGVIIDGVRLVDFAQKLTLASDKDLAQFSANDDVTQDSGYTPVTSAITNVVNSTVSKVKAYYSAVRPNNLAEAITGTEYDLTKANTNVVENSHYLTLVCEDGCPTSGQVFKTDGGPIFDMKWSSGGGNFDKDGTQLDAASNPPSGPSDTTEILFSDGGTTGYIVNIQAAYTILTTTNLGTVPVVVDAAQSDNSVLDLTDDKDLANFRVGDIVPIPDNGTQTAEVKFVVNSPYQVDTVQYYIRSGYSDDVGTGAPPGEYVDIIKVTEAGDLQLNATAYENLGGVTVELINGDPNGEGLTFSGDSATRICPATVTFGAGGGEMRIKWNKPTTTSHVIYYLWYSGKNNSTWKGNILGNGATYEVEPAKQGSVTAIGPGNTLTLDTPGFSIGETVTGPATTPATGTVASTDPAAKTMTLATSDESGTKRWIVNAGKTVVGPTGPATRFDAYLTWSGKQVTGLSTTDPGYFQAPPDLQLQFTDPAPSGQTWDQELPTGTTIQTRVKATNASGEANSGWSNVVTPRFLSASHVDESEHCYGEACVRFATFENRAAVYQGEQAMAERERLAEELRAAGLDAEEIDELLNQS